MYMFIIFIAPLEDLTDALKHGGLTVLNQCYLL